MDLEKRSFYALALAPPMKMWLFVLCSENGTIRSNVAFAAALIVAFYNYIVRVHTEREGEHLRTNLAVNFKRFKYRK